MLGIEPLGTVPLGVAYESETPVPPTPGDFGQKFKPDIYDVVITGIEDGKDDFVYVLKSFNGILYSGLTSHLNFNFPRQKNDIDEIIDRPNGKILLRQNEVEIYRGDQSGFDFYQGSSNSTFSISAGYTKDESENIAYELPIEKITNDYDGTRRIKVPGFYNFLPLDYIIIDQIAVQIDQVIVNISSNGAYLMLREL